MDHHALIDEIVQELRRIDGVSAVVLGGSRARGTHTPSSDIDLGIYYDPAAPLDIPALQQLAARLDDTHRTDLLTLPGGWGPWINGGGWLTIQGVPVDFLYRDVSRVGTIIEDCRAGRVEIVYQPGHPHGFVSSIYMAEIAVCQPLWQAHNELTALKSQTNPYPAALRSALTGKFTWEIQFALDNAKKAVPRADVSYIAGCAFRAVACMTQVLFALNRQYCLNEKGAVALVETFTVRPPNWKNRVEDAFQRLMLSETERKQSLDSLFTLAQEVADLANRYNG